MKKLADESTNILDPACGRGANRVSDWLRVLCVVFCLGIISLFLLGKLPAGAVTTAVWLICTYVSKGWEDSANNKLSGAEDKLQGS